MYSFAVRRGLVDSNPCEKAVVKKTDGRRTRFLSLAEIRKLGEACDKLEEEGFNPKALNITRMWILTGCRRQEIVELKWDEVDFERGLLVLADSKTEAYAAEAMVKDAAGKFDAGENTAMVAACAKYYASEMVGRVADRAVQVFGAMGVTDDSPVADFYAGMRALRIYDGPDEVHVRTIARAEFDRQAALHPEGLMRYLCTDFSDRSRWEGAPAHG